MSEALRAVALSEAVKHGSQAGLGIPEIVDTAEAFLVFLGGEGGSPGKSSAAGAEPTKPKATAATVVKKAIAAMSKKATKSEDELAQEALESAEEETEAEADEPEAEAGEDEIPATKEGVGAVINKLLKAGKRPAALGLLKKFKAASVSGVQAKDYKKFVAEGSKLLGSEDDLEG